MQEATERNWESQNPMPGPICTFHSHHPRLELSASGNQRLYKHWHIKETSLIYLVKEIVIIYWSSSLKCFAEEGKEGLWILTSLKSISNTVTQKLLKSRKFSLSIELRCAWVFDIPLLSLQKFYLYWTQHRQDIKKGQIEHL